MVVEVSNPQNSSMHYGDKPPVKVVNAPDSLPKRVLYTNAEANEIYHQMQYDIYDKSKQAKRSRGGFSTILKSIALVGILTCAVVFRKNITNFCKKIFKNPFKK